MASLAGKINAGFPVRCGRAIAIRFSQNRENPPLQSKMNRGRNVVKLYQADREDVAVVGELPAQRKGAYSTIQSAGLHTKGRRNARKAPDRACQRPCDRPTVAPSANRHAQNDIEFCSSYECNPHFPTQNEPTQTARRLAKAHQPMDAAPARWHLRRTRTARRQG